MRTSHWCQKRDSRVCKRLGAEMSEQQEQGEQAVPQAAALVSNLVSVPDKFDDGDVELWLKRFSMCASANGWDNAKKLVYLTTYLRGRAFAVYERLLDADSGTYAALEAALKKVFTPRTEESRRLAHSQLASRRLKEGEDLDIFVRDLERLLDKAYPGIQDPLQSQQLLDYFLGAYQKVFLTRCW